MRNPAILIICLALTCLSAAGTQTANDKILLMCRCCRLYTVPQPDSRALAEGRALSVAIGLLVVILVWNRRLKVLSEKRGQELAEEQVQHATTELKVMERTRLSVELHDALSQTLSGIAKQLGISLDMVKKHITALLAKMNVANRSEAVAIALKKQLLKV